MASLPGLDTSEGGVMVRKLMMISAANTPSTSRLITKRAATCEVRKEISKGVTRAVYTSAREVRRSQRLRKADVRGSSRMRHPRDPKLLTMLLETCSRKRSRSRAGRRPSSLGRQVAGWSWAARRSARSRFSLATAMAPVRLLPKELAADSDRLLSAAGLVASLGLLVLPRLSSDCTLRMAVRRRVTARECSAFRG
jgi:hypothetical protein